MDGVITLCQVTPHCTRLDRHEGACNLSVPRARRTPSSRLRYLAKKLDKGGDLGVRLAVAQALRDLAQELE